MLQFSNSMNLFVAHAIVVNNELTKIQYVKIGHPIRVFNPYFARTELLPFNIVSIMIAESLDPDVAWTSESI